MNAWPVFLLCAVLACCIYFILNPLRANYKKCNGHMLPPGPWGLPIIGHLHMLGDLPHRNLHKLANKFGPIMYLRLGMVPTVVVSSPEAAELFLKNHDLIFADRPKNQAAEFLSYGQTNLAFGQYGSRWRNLRKLCRLELLSSSKIESMKCMRREYVQSLVEWVKDAAETSSVVDVSAKVGSLVEDMTFAMVFGSKDVRYELKSCIQESLRLAGAFNFADFVPFFAALDLQGLRRRMKAVSKVLDGFLENILDEHAGGIRAQKVHYQKDFIDTMLSLKDSSYLQEQPLDRATIKALILDIIGGSMDIITAIDWTLSDLFKQPRVLQQVQSELENAVRLDRMVDESDLSKLHYLDLVIKESMRLHPVGPLLVPHESREDITINGYHIPKSSRIIVNFWAIGRDPHVWSADVEEFYPERFLDTNLDYNGRDLRFIPFGSGRRGCPGMLLGLAVVRLVVAQLIHCFSWELPNGMQPADLDMNEKFGVSIPRANHLFAIPAFRLRIDNNQRYF